MDAILHWLNDGKRLPRGVLITAPAVQDYACRAGCVPRKLAFWPSSKILHDKAILGPRLDELSSGFKIPYFGPARGDISE